MKASEGQQKWGNRKEIHAGKEVEVVGHVMRR